MPCQSDLRHTLEPSDGNAEAAPMRQLILELIASFSKNKPTKPEE